MAYTLAQAKAFATAAARDDRHREAALAMATRMGMAADGTAWTTYLDRLQR